MERIAPPRAGAVIKYSYLWSREAVQGATEARKDRPAAIIVAVQESLTGDLHVIALPITSQAPVDLKIAVAISPAVNERLGLDSKPSWVICDEYNQFVWPSADLKPIAHKQHKDWEYGLLPQGIFGKVQKLVLALRKQRKLKRVVRTL